MRLTEKEKQTALDWFDKRFAGVELSETLRLIRSEFVRLCEFKTQDWKRRAKFVRVAGPVTAHHWSFEWRWISRLLYQATKHRRFVMPYPPVNCEYGAPMGRADWTDCKDQVVLFHLARVRGVDGGDYDTGGAYWGDLLRSPLYQAFGYAQGSDQEQRMFVRAATRNEAKEKILAVFKHATFYR